MIRIRYPSGPGVPGSDCSSRACRPAQEPISASTPMATTAPASSGHDERAGQRIWARFSTSSMSIAAALAQAVGPVGATTVARHKSTKVAITSCQRGHRERAEPIPAMRISALGASRMLLYGGWEDWRDEMSGRQNEVPIQQGVSPGGQELVRLGANYTLYRYKKENCPFVPSPPGEQLPIFALLGAGAEPEPYQPYLDEGASLSPAGTTREAFATAQSKTLQELVEALSASPELLLYIHGCNNSSATVADRTNTYPSKLLKDTQEKDESAGIGGWLSYDWPGERAFFGKTLGRSLRTAAELACY